MFFLLYGVFFFKHKQAYEMRISDWSSDVCSSDLYPSSTRLGGSAASTLVSAEAVATRVLNRSQPGPVAIIPSRAVPSSCAPSKAPPISAKDFSVSRTAAFSSAILVLQRRSEAR